MSFTVNGGEFGNLIGLPIRISCGDKPVFRFAVDLIVMRAMGRASGHFNPVCSQILASLFFRNPFCPCRLWMLRAIEVLLDLQNPTHLLHHLGCKMSSLIAGDPTGSPKPTDKILHQPFNHSNGICPSTRVNLNPLGEQIYDDQNKLKATALW